jgi:hypothetical protein
MPYKFPRQHFDRTAYVSLNQAFHLVGSYTFPENWTGKEISAFPTVASGSLKAEKDELSAAVEVTQERANEIRLDYYREDDHQARLQLGIVMEEATQKRDLAKTAFDSFIRDFDRSFRDANAFGRKQSVEAVLCRAIRKRELQTHLDFGMVHGDLMNWVNDRKFRVSFSHSYIVTPSGFGGRSKHRAYFDKRAFELWTKPLTEGLLAYRTQPLADDLILWFKGYRDELLQLSKRPSQESALKACRETFNRTHEASNLKRLVDATWQLYAPDSWKKGGKPTKPD